ncbi:MAG: KTSC domain-containing protein [Caulobacteraceae bacterium]|nr:KTSC domain-containing protein [Caulobacteraceae bacterium]
MARSWDPKNQPDQQIRLEAAQRLDPRAELYQVDPDVAVELLRLQQGTGGSYTSIDSVFKALPTAPSVGEFAKSGAFAEAKSLFFDEQVRASQFGYDITTGTYYVTSSAYDPVTKSRYTRGGIEYNNWADDPRDYETEPAPITVKPTSTTNPNKPRTIAAGYRPGTSEDGSAGTLTVIFRDGSYYNYYEVEPYLWQQFKQVKSKGRFIRKYLDQKPRGYASVSYITSIAQKSEYFISRTNQILSKGIQGHIPKRQPSLERRLLLQERAARKAAKMAKAGAQNPSRNKGRKKA